MSRGRPEGRLRWSTRPLGVAECRRPVQLPAFAPGSSEVAVGFLVSLYLLSIMCPNCTCTQLFLVPYSFFVSVGGGEAGPGTSPAAEGPRSQPVHSNSELLLRRVSLAL